MHTVTSADGTRIAYDRYGDGPALILIIGAMGQRKFKKFEQIAQALSAGFTVINQNHNVKASAIVPVLREFLASASPAAV